MSLLFLFCSVKPRPLGGVRINWFCLTETTRSIGVMEHWSVDLKTKEK